MPSSPCVAAIITFMTVLIIGAVLTVAVSADAPIWMVALTACLLGVSLISAGTALILCARIRP